MNYIPPPWSNNCEATFELEVHKGGLVIDQIQFKKPFQILGRDAEILCEHPSISRNHAVF